MHAPLDYLPRYHDRLHAQFPLIRAFADKRVINLCSSSSHKSLDVTSVKRYSTRLCNHPVILYFCDFSDNVSEFPSCDVGKVCKYFPSQSSFLRFYNKIGYFALCNQGHVHFIHSFPHHFANSVILFIKIASFALLMNPPAALACPPVSSEIPSSILPRNSLAFRLEALIDIFILSSLDAIPIKILSL